MSDQNSPHEGRSINIKNPYLLLVFGLLLGGNIGNLASFISPELEKTFVKHEHVDSIRDDIKVIKEDLNLIKKDLEQLRK